MISFDDERSIAIIEISCLKRTIDKISNNSEPNEILDIYIRIEEFCRLKRDGWKRLNNAFSESIGNINVELSECIDLLLPNIVNLKKLSNEFVWQKLILTVSILLDCLSSNVDVESNYSNFINDIIENCVWRRDHKKSDQTDGLLELRYSIIEIIIKHILPRFGRHQDFIAACWTMFLTLLDLAAYSGKTKLVAQLCSVVLEEIALRRVPGKDISSLAKEILLLLIDQKESDDEYCNLETRCVGVYCLIATIRKLNVFANGLVVEDGLSAFIPCKKLLVHLVGICLISDKPFVRKCGRSLLSLLLFSSDEIGAKMWTNYLTLMETFELKQVHVVKPAFGLLDTLIRHCESSRDTQERTNTIIDQFDVSWLLLAYYNALHHPNAYVIKWAIGRYFQMDVNLLPAAVGEDCKFLFDTVLRVIDRSDTYYRFADENSLHSFIQDMDRFFRCVANQWPAETLWRNWLRTLKEYNWGPVPLFYASHVLSKISDDHVEIGIFQASDLDIFRSVFWSFRHIPIPFLRSAIQEANLKIFLNLFDWNKSTMLSACVKVLAFIPPRLIRPSKALRYVRREENYSWMSTLTFVNKLNDLASLVVSDSSGNENQNDLVWTLDAYRALIAVSSFTKSHPTPAEVVSIVLKDSVSLLDKHYISSILQLTSLLERREDIVRDITIRNEGYYCEIIRTSLHRLCSIKEISKNELDIYDRFFHVALLPELLIKCDANNLLELLIGTYQKHEINYIRRYYILRTISLLLLRWPTVWAQNANSSATWIFVSQLPLESDTVPSDIDHSIEPSERNRIVSGHMAVKWSCFAYLCKEITENELGSNQIDCNKTAENGLNALDVISCAEDARRVMECLALVLGKLTCYIIGKPELMTAIIRKMHAVCLEYRKCDQFIPTVQSFCTAAFQLPLLLSDHNAIVAELHKVVDSFISETENPSLACCLSEAINRALTSDNGISETSKCSSTIGFSFVQRTLVELCCCGNILRKDQKAVYDACEMIKEFGPEVYACNKLIESDHLASQMTRLYAFQSLLFLLEHFETKRQAMIGQLIELSCDKLKELICGATKGGYFANSLCHRTRTRAVQILLLVEPYIQHYDTALRLQQFTIKYLTEYNQQPSVRLLLEWLMTRLNVRFASAGLLEKWWDADAHIIEKRVGSLCSWMEVLMHTGLCLPADQRRRHTLECAKRILPWCTAQNFTVRCCAQTCLRKLWDEERKSDIAQERLISDRDWDMLMEFLTPIVVFDKEQRNNTKNVEKASKDFYFAVFNAVRDYTLQTIFHTFPRLCFLPIDEFIPVSMWRLLCLQGNLLNKMVIENPSDALAKSNVFIWKDKAQETRADEIAQNTGYESLQTKTNLFVDDTEFLLSTATRGRELSRNDGLIVVASLIDRPTNLGGLCRTCEIFGAKELTVSTYRVAEDFEFQLLSVSSEKWVKMIEVKPADLVSYLRQKQTDGFTIVAVEQTTTSRRLTDYQFSAKTLLLLGNEKEGIPVDLLQCVDICVEIPQLGHTRSLNVHVAGALLIWEYAKQHRFLK